MTTPIRCALVSVSDKSGIAELGAALVRHGVKILSTGGTAKALRDSGIDVVEVSDHTGFPEMMAGRVKTLHPKIHGGLLGRRDVDADAMLENDIDPIDLVVVNLYPFEQTISKPECDFETAIENIDIGGPAMLRSAAKNHAAVAVVVDPGDYTRVIDEMDNNKGAVTDALRFDLAVKTFEHTASYDGAIANYLTQRHAPEGAYPRSVHLTFNKAGDMRYGENPHQSAAFYTERKPPASTIAAAELIQGKALSYNNVADADAALECVRGFDEGPACVIVKHANPCGVALGDDIASAYERAFITDPTSAFGGIIAFNRPLSAELAAHIVERQFVEVIIAPEIEVGAREALSTKPNVRALQTGPLGAPTLPGHDFKRVGGGLLVQDRDQGRIVREDLKFVTERQPTESEVNDLLFAWKVVKFVKSNAIVYCKDGMTVGVGAGQMSRVYSAKIGAIKAADENLQIEGAVLASDAFFPFRDGVDQAAQAGVTAVIQPGGSMRDDEAIAAANEHGMAMAFTGMRHFRH